MHLVGVSHPPEVQPVRVDLVVCDQDQTFREVSSDASVGCESDLAEYTAVTTDAHRGRGTPLGQRGDGEAKGLLGQGDPCIKVLFLDDIERQADDLGYHDAGAAAAEPGNYEKAADKLDEDAIVCRLSFVHMP